MGALVNVVVARHTKRGHKVVVGLDAAALAAAPDAEVMGEWAGLGYYARARNLLKCARAVVAGEGVRYGLVPWNDELSSPSQRQLLAQ